MIEDHTQRIERLKAHYNKLATLKNETVEARGIQFARFKRLEVLDKWVEEALEALVKAQIEAELDGDQ